MLDELTYRSPINWDEMGERKFLGSESVNEVIGKIRAWMIASQDWHNSYVDLRRYVECVVGDYVFLRVSLMKGVKRFGKKVKLCPRYVGPFEILDRVGQVAYRLAMHPNLSQIHNVFHLSMLGKYVSDPSHILSYETMNLQENMSYEEEQVQILDKKENVLRNKIIALVNVLWRNNVVKEATWEL
ncbi:uncharacterized protein LOC133815035 [Humulus lupulus]|uniref:uncharacterized protein LOC133815035 n=1 Tax=Humulus lupulus TaxID=3486 RepID=UPI002B40EA79|nr:uncharacterized protein LOC133815035 [Humulus lupulus]